MTSKRLTRFSEIYGVSTMPANNPKHRSGHHKWKSIGLCGEETGGLSKPLAEAFTLREMVSKSAQYTE